MIESAVAKLGTGPLTEEGIKAHILPLFSRVLSAKVSQEIYLANHSLGRPLDQTSDDVARGVNLWFSKLDRAWADDAWPAEMNAFRQRVSKLLGLSEPHSVVPKTSAGQGLRAVLNALPQDGSSRPVQVVSTRGEFDSIDFILKTYVAKGKAEVRWVETKDSEGGIPLFTAESILVAISPGVDLVVVSMVAFTTGQIQTDLVRIIEKSHSVGALVLVDVYHACGVIPIEMETMEIDLVIGGSYKYIRGGPGACWLAIHPDVLKRGLRTLDTGWFAKKSPFAYDRSDEPEVAEGGDGWLESTPPVITAYQASAGLRFTLAIGVDRIRAYNLQQQALLQDAFVRLDVPVFAPKQPEEFGAFTLLPSTDAKALSAELLKVGVNTDARGGTVRFGPDLLNTSAELERAAELTAQVLSATS